METPPAWQPECSSAAPANSAPDWRDRKRDRERLGTEATTRQLLEWVERGHRDPGNLDIALQLLAERGITANDGLSSLLSHPDPDVRIYAALGLGRSRGDVGEAGPLLLGALEDENLNVRQHAVEALASLGYRAAVPALRSLLRGDFFLAFSAADALGKIGDSAAVPDLVALLGDEMLAEPAATALVEIHDHSSHGKDTVERAVSEQASAETLLQLPPGSDSARLCQWLLAHRPTLDTETAALLRDRAGEGPSSSAPVEPPELDEDSLADMLAELECGGSGSLQSILRALSGLSPADKLESLLPWLTSSNARARLAAVGALAATPLESAHVQSLLSSPEALLRQAGARLLAHSSESWVEPLLLTCLFDSKDEVRRCAVESLTGFVAGNPVLAGRLAEILERDAGPHVRAAAARSLAQADPEVARPALIRALSDPAGWTRMQACRTLAGFARDEDLEPLLGLLEDPQPYVRSSLAVVLAGYPGQAAPARA